MIAKRLPNFWTSLNSKASGQKGFTVSEILVSSVITLSVLGAAVQTVMHTFHWEHDSETQTRVNEVAQAILDYMVFDIRVAGAGMPLGQSLFPLQSYVPSSSVTIPPSPNWGDATYTLGDATWPLLPGSDSSNIHVRLNERGVETVLSNNYDPGAGDDLSVTDLNDFIVGDIIYIYDRRIAGNAGLRGLVTGRNPASNAATGPTPGTLTISATRNTSTISGVPYVFEAGSSINRVSTVSYISPADWSGIQIAISDYDPTPRVMYPNTRFSIVYRDRNGAAINLPSSVSSQADVAAVLLQMLELGSIQVTVTVRGENRLWNGSTYEAVVSQDIVLRNLLLSNY